MSPADYRIESSAPLAGLLLPRPGAREHLFSSRSLAVAMAAKSTTPGQEIRVVHVPTGEVVFRKAGASRAEGSEDF